MAQKDRRNLLVGWIESGRRSIYLMQQKLKEWRCFSSLVAATANARRRSGILDRAGYEGWAKFVTRSDDDPHPTVEAFKTEERRKLAEAGYTIIATVGDQEGDLEGGFAECRFKVPNPFYFIR